MNQQGWQPELSQLAVSGGADREASPLRRRVLHAEGKHGAGGRAVEDDEESSEEEETQDQRPVAMEGAMKMASERAESGVHSDSDFLRKLQNVLAKFQCGMAELWIGTAEPSKSWLDDDRDADIFEEADTDAVSLAEEEKKKQTMIIRPAWGW
eukprot:s3485_g13.t1